jgi:hypothetical protein
MITTLSAMQLSFIKSRIIGVLVALVVALSGCSSLRFAYNSAPDLVYWWLDGYVDFSEEQAPRVHELLSAWQRWHRSTQLAEYAALLARAQTEVPGPATAAQACRWMDEITKHMNVALAQALPAAAELALDLSPGQMKHLERRYAKSNEEFRAEFLLPVPKERLEASIKRAVDRAETLYGRLDEPQRERIASGVAASPFDAQLWLEERQARQADILRTLRQITDDAKAGRPPQPVEVQAALRAVVQRVERSPRPAYLAYRQRLSQYNCAFAADLHNLTTPAQRQTAVNKLKGWESDLRALAADGR